MTARMRALAMTVAVLAGACGDGSRGAAEAALASAERSLAVVSTDAARYVPDQLKAVEAAIASAQGHLVKGNSQQALSEAQALPTKLATLTTAVTTRKAEITRRWEEATAGLPALIQSIEDRIEQVSALQQLPEGVDPRTVANARRSLDTIKRTWADANAAFAAGNLADAALIAQGVRARVVEVMTALYMKVPAALR